MCNTKCDINNASDTQPLAMVFRNAWFTRFATKHEITDEILRAAVKRAEGGLIDADLGGGVIKQRLARTGAGKSSGFRSIIVFQREDKAFFIYGFAKNKTGNLKPSELVAYPKAARLLLALTENELNALIANGTFEEIKTNE